MLRVGKSGTVMVGKRGKNYGAGIGRVMGRKRGRVKGGKGR